MNGKICIYANLLENQFASNCRRGIQIKRRICDKGRMVHFIHDFMHMFCTYQTNTQEVLQGLELRVMTDIEGPCTESVHHFRL
jgi:hypothetical protein